MKSRLFWALTVVFCLISLPAFAAAPTAAGQPKPTLLLVHPADSGQWYGPEELPKMTGPNVYEKWFEAVGVTITRVTTEDELNAAWQARSRYNILTFAYHAWQGSRWLRMWAAKHKAEIVDYVAGGGAIVTNVGRDGQEIILAKMFGLDKNLAIDALGGMEPLFNFQEHEKAIGAGILGECDLAPGTPFSVGLPKTLGPKGIGGDPNFVFSIYSGALPDWVKYTAGTVTDDSGDVCPVIIAGAYQKGRLVFGTPSFYQPENLAVKDGKALNAEFLRFWQNCVGYAVSR